MVKTYRNLKNKNKNKNKNKTIKSIKSIKSIKTKPRNKKQSGGGDTIIINKFHDIETRKAALIESFELFNEIYQIYLGKTLFGYVNFSSALNSFVTLSYNVPLAYNSYHNFFDILIQNDIIKCNNLNACPEASLTSYLTSSGQYKFFKIYFSIGFIMAYYFTHPTLFVSEEYLKKKGVNSTIVGFKDLFLTVACNLFTNNANYCKLKKSFDEFISINGFNLTENKNITAAIFNFVDSIRHFKNIDDYFDISLYPK